MEDQRLRSNLPLHTSKVVQPIANINRAFTLLRSITILALLYYRVSCLFLEDTPLLPWVLMSISEFVISFIFLLNQAFTWRPITRSVFPERLPKDGELPPVDVFICTADPKKEPVEGVMNTVISALTLDYPTKKLFVYLSDDAGSPLTLYATKEAFLFARSWIPFCRKYGIATGCPEAYFATSSRDHDRTVEFIEEEEKIKSKYEVFKERVEKAEESVTAPTQDRPPLIQVIHDNRKDAATKLPSLVYVAREKRREHPHHFKAGALNVLLRVSGVISNSPYVLVLDCDMYCNDPTSARQAMCLHLDPQITSSLAFVIFPQMFYNVSKNDIYDGQMRSAFKTKWQGMDGILGPILSGSGFYMKRHALYRNPYQEDIDLHQLKNYFGSSNKLIASLRQSCKSDAIDIGKDSHARLQEAELLATCTYEKDTQWGEKMGFLYHCLLESTFTGYYLHCQGWKSVYIYPSKPAFLGCPATNMRDVLVQGSKWISESFRVGFSRFCPLIYGLSRMSILQSMCYGYILMFTPFFVIFMLYGPVIMLGLLNGISLYPKVSDPWFAVFAIAFVTCLVQHLFDVLSTGGSILSWWNEVRIWLIKSVTSNFCGCLDALMKMFRIKKTDLNLTNKAVDKEQLEKYENGKFDFQGTNVNMIIPLLFLVLLNMVSFIVGVVRVIIEKSYDEMFGQVFLSFFILIISYPIIEGMKRR